MRGDESKSVSLVVKAVIRHWSFVIGHWFLSAISWIHPTTCETIVVILAHADQRGTMPIRTNDE
jgi:hypothetical protein